jgi:hypothetical protein
MKPLAAFAVLGLSLQMAPAAPDAAPDLKGPSWKMVALHNGSNAVDVNSDGHVDLVVVARRENYNAHGFDATTIYLWGPTTPEAPHTTGTLHIVPVERKEPEGEDPLVLRTAGGADGLLHDFRLFTDATHHAAVLVTATRRFGESFADTQPVTFEYFRLARNEEGIPGWATFYFKAYKKEESKKPHQDVNEAFKSELGIGSDGRVVE